MFWMTSLVGYEIFYSCFCQDIYSVRIKKYSNTYKYIHLHIYKGLTVDSFSQGQNEDSTSLTRS